MAEFGDSRLPARIWALLEVGESGCWSWLGRSKVDGYGLARINGREGAVHRLVWDVLSGEPLPRYSPTGPQLDHLCRNRACCNPRHMEIVSPQVNTLRGATIAALRAAQEACVSGHEFDAANTIIRRDGCRDCRTCKNERNQRYKQRKRHAAGTLAA